MWSAVEISLGNTRSFAPRRVQIPPINQTELLSHFIESVTNASQLNTGLKLFIRA